MSNTGYDFGFRSPQYAESTEELYKHVRTLIESIKDTCTVVMEETSFSISENPKKTATQANASTNTQGTITLNVSPQNVISITCKSDGYSLSITVNSRASSFHIKDDELYEEYKDFFSEKWEKQINEEAIKSINELFNQTELKRKVDLDNLLND